MRADSFSRQLFLPLAGLFLLLLAAAVIFGEISFRRALGGDVDERMWRMCEALAEPATDLLVNGGDRSGLVHRLRDLAATEHLRLTVVAADGSVVADSEVQGPLANHRERAEVVAAEQLGTGRAERLSSSTGKKSAYLARRLDHAGNHVGYIRATSEETGAQGPMRGLDTVFVMFGLGAAVLGLGVIALITRRLSRPIETLERDAARLAAGDVPRIEPAGGALEVRRLCETLNAMSYELHSRLDLQRRARSEVEAILASMSEGLVAVDGDENVLLMNQAAASMLGLQAPLAPGTALWASSSWPDLELALRGALAERGVWHGDARSPSQGHTIALSVAPIASASAGEDALPAGAVAVLADVTAIRNVDRGASSGRRGP